MFVLESTKDSCYDFKRGWIGFVRRRSFGRRIFYYGSVFVKFATNNIIKFVNMDLFLRESYKSIDILFNYDMIKS